MKTIEALVIGGLLLGTAIAVERYLTTDCMITERAKVNNEYTVTRSRTGKCYLIKE